MFPPTSLVGCFSQRDQPNRPAVERHQWIRFSSGLLQSTNSAGCNEFSRLFQPASSTVCRVTKIDSFSSRLCQTPNSSGCCSQRVQPAVSASKIKRSASMIVLSMAVVIVMLWRWRCFFFPGWFMHVTLTIRLPCRDVIDAAKKGRAVTAKTDLCCTRHGQTGGGSVNLPNCASAVILLVMSFSIL